MTTKKHKKHSELVKPKGGIFGSQEIALIGAPCSRIQELSNLIQKEVGKDFKLSYIDADHSEKPVAHEGITYTDKIGSHQVVFSSEYINYEFRQFLNAADLVLVNGNHFKAQKQIVIINSAKKESLERKLDRLSDVKLILLDENQTEVYDFLKSNLENYGSIPVLRINAIKEIAEFIKTEILKSTPKIKGLVLAGGKSTRMGKDKTQIVYHGKRQVEHAAELLNKVCDQVYISVGANSRMNTGVFEKIPDTYSGLGPYGGILSAFQSDPNSAWFTIASDIPLLNEDTLGYIANNRDSSRYATCLHNKETGFPEPLITTWEPRAYQRMLYFLSLGYSCPRKVLINSDVLELELEDQKQIMNVNTPEELEKAKSLISS